VQKIMGDTREDFRDTRLVVQYCALLVLLLGAGDCLAQKDEPATVVVRMTDSLRFEPDRVVVHAGDTVEWQNSSSQPHTVTADAQRAALGKEVVLPSGATPFDSGKIEPGDTYRHTFTVPGTYKYICVPHVDFGMVGEVVVQPPPTGSSPPHAEAPEEPPKDAKEEAGGWPSGLAGEIVRWLGKFHPPASNFPIALLVAAAISEILWAVTGRPVFDAASRYCLWFGALAGVLTGTLGWFLGGLHTADASWILATHRWLGTSTDVLAVVALLMGEASRRYSQQSVRRWFGILLVVVALMVLAAGFFGGALVYGIRHYEWR
jgi:plastocyanin